MKVICIDGKEARIFVTVCDPLIDRLLGRDLYLLVRLLSRIKLFLVFLASFASSSCLPRY